MPSAASRLHGTWSRCKYYHHRILSQKYGHMMSLTDELRSHFTRIHLLLNTAVRDHSTQTSQAAKWEIPKGYDSKIMVYNPLVKEKVPLILLQEKVAQWYACGPTVYDNAHIGHASSYVRLDIIRRIMSSTFDIDTTLVMGVTDIDDKIIKKSNQTGQALNELARFYESDFFASLAKLNVSPPSMIVRVTDNIHQIIDFIVGIEKAGLTYKTSDGSVYFDVNQYGRYGVFSGLQQGVTQEVDSEKRAAQDFAVWKASKPGEPFWESPWDKGRPGWHIECSAMASNIFGANFDIHSGGEDLTFPHHENELAQSCAYHSNTQWVNYWIHTGHLFVSGQNDKMSKSLKNVITVSEFLENYTPNQFRMLCLLNSYRNRIEFSDERMQKAISTMTTFNSIVSRCDLYVSGQIHCADIPEAELYERLHSTRRAVEAAFADDFNTPKALANVMRLVKFTNQLLGEGTDEQKVKFGVRSSAPVAAVGTYIQRLLKQLGLDLAGRKAEVDHVAHLQFSNTVDTVVSTRTKIRQFVKDRQFFLQSAGEVGIPEDQALKLMTRLYKPLWDISDNIRADILTSANVQITDDAVSSRWNIVDSAKKSSVADSLDEARDTNSQTKKMGDINSAKEEKAHKSKTPAG